MKPRFNTLVILGIGLIATSLASTLIRFAQGSGAPSIVIAAFRLTIAAVIMGIGVVSQRSWGQYRTLSAKSIVLIVASGIMLGGHFSAWISALDLTSVANAVVLVKTNPIWVGLIAPLMLKEKTSRVMWLSIALVVLGAITVSVAGQANAPTQTQTSVVGDGLAVLGALLVTGYYLIGRFVRNELDLFPYLFAVYGVAAITSSVLVLALPLPLFSLPSQAWVWMIAIGLIPQLIGHSSINFAMRHLNASFVTNITLADALPAILFAGIFLREFPSLLQLVGAAIVLAGIFVATTARAPTPEIRNIQEKQHQSGSK